jgi:hypothetical protein
MKYKRSRIPLVIIGYDAETRRPIYEHRTICNFCQRQFKLPAHRANHELHLCDLNPDVKKIKRSLKHSIENPKSLILTIHYRLFKESVYNLLKNPTKFYPYSVLDEITKEIHQFRQTIKWLKQKQLNTIVTMVEYKHETAIISADEVKPKRKTRTKK